MRQLKCNNFLGALDHISGEYGFFGFRFSLNTELISSTAVLTQQMMSLATAP